MMRRFLLRTLPCFTPALLAPGAGCVLDPKSVGDESTSQATDSPSTDDDTGQAAEATIGEDPTTLGDDASAGGDDEWFELWPGIDFHRVARDLDGRALTLAYHDEIDGSVVHYYDDAGAEIATASWAARYFEAFAVGIDGNLVAGGWQQPAADPLGKDATLWLLGEDGIAEHELILAGGDSFVTEVVVGGGMLWTLTVESPSPEDPHWGVLRRHGSEGVVELAHPLLARSTTLAVDVDGFAYTIADGGSPQLHRVAPEGGVVWSLPVEVALTGTRVLQARPDEPGVVIVSAVDGGRRVRALDGDGVVLHDFTTVATQSELPPAAHVGDAILLAHTLPPEEYMVEARSFDGTQQWSAVRNVPDATSISIADVIEVPGGAAVIGSTMRFGTTLGFIRFIPAP